jgi:hypothetical protein
MLYREIIAVCSEIHTKHINTLCGQNVGLTVAQAAARLAVWTALQQCSRLAPGEGADDLHRRTSASREAYIP